MPRTPWDVFGTDPEIEKSGAWINYGDFAFLIAPIGNENYKRLIKTVLKPYQRQIDSGTLSDEVGEERLALVYAKTILLDWWCSEWGDHTIWGPNGERLDFSVENAKKMLLEMPKFAAAVREEADTASNFQKREEDEAVGNSPTSSTTSSGQGVMKNESSPPPKKEA
jgi:hypothetical protein